MFEVKVVSRFCAAHFLENYKGKCESLHGHNWKVEAVAASLSLDNAGMVMDFKDLKEFLEEILEQFDHKLLNEIPFLKENNTTSENIAKYVYIELNKKILEYNLAKTTKIFTKEVAVWEQENSCATYREDQKL